MANLYAKNKWQYQDAQTLLEAVERTRKQKRDADLMA